MNNEMTFNEYAKYLNRKEEKIRNAICQALDVLEVPIEVDCAPSINVDLTEVTDLEHGIRQFIVTDVTINVNVKF